MLGQRLCNTGLIKREREREREKEGGRGRERESLNKKNDFNNFTVWLGLVRFS
jgi:hypothetical protein